jgi:cobalt-zinc-cadmium efflux system outer membrane protein
MINLRYVALLFALLWATMSWAQSDSLRLSPTDADARFIRKNLAILATKYNIDIAKALTDQTRLWDNPTLTFENNLFNLGGGGTFMGLDQEFLQVQQLIKLAGKRKKLTDLTAENEQLAAHQLNDLMRHLRYQLHTDLFALQNTQNRISLYQRELKTIQQLLLAIKTQVQQGNMALKEQIRLEALQNSIQHTINDEEVNALLVQGDLKTLLRVSGDTAIIVVLPKKTPANLPTIADLVATALSERPDISLAKSARTLQEKNLVYQQALKYPDLLVGITYDRQSNFTPHYTGVNVSLPLPIFNKNQGNIKAAEFGVKQQEMVQSQVQAQVETEVWAAFVKYKQLQALKTPDK